MLMLLRQQQGEQRRQAERRQISKQTKNETNRSFMVDISPPFFWLTAIAPVRPDAVTVAQPRVGDAA